MGAPCGDREQRTPHAPPLAAAQRADGRHHLQEDEELAALGFQVGKRGLRRTKHAGQYPPRLCTAWAQVIKAAAAGLQPAVLHQKLQKAETDWKAARAGERRGTPRAPECLLFAIFNAPARPQVMPDAYDCCICWRELSMGFPMVC